MGSKREKGASAPRHLTFHHLLEACQKDGCPLCYLVASAERRYLDGLLYESVNDPALRERLRQGGGFCPKHAWQLAHIRGAALGVAILAKDLLDSALERLQRTKPVPPRAPDCPACELAATSAARYVRELVVHQADPQVQSAFGQCSGLCLPHLEQALATGLSGALRSLALEKLQALSTELEKFISKHDYRFISQGFGPEGTSWLRATAALVGRKQLP